MRISDWSSDVCSSDLWICPALLALNARIFMVPARIPPPLSWKTELLPLAVPARLNREPACAMADALLVKVRLWPASLAVMAKLSSARSTPALIMLSRMPSVRLPADCNVPLLVNDRSEEHTSELQSLMRISYAVFCLKKKKTHQLTQVIT